MIGAASFLKKLDPKYVRALHAKNARIEYSVK
jgi:hypothetical protein